MDAGTRMVVGAFAVIVLILLVIVAAQYFENRRMRSVLIDQTLENINAEFERARREEEENVAVLRASLQDTLERLGGITGLTESEQQLIRRARDLTSQILEATTSTGLEF